MNAGTVVAHAHTAYASLLDFNAHRFCTGIEAVLQQFLDDRRRAFDDFARGNLVCHELGQGPDAPAQLPPSLALPG